VASCHALGKAGAAARSRPRAVLDRIGAGASWRASCFDRVVNRVLSGKTTWRVHEHAESGVLVDGRDYYFAFYQAALRARRSILLLGWQFDSDVHLVRGADRPRGASAKDVELSPFLDRLCHERPDLEVRILAWDHSLVFTLEREVLQKIVFDVTTSSRLHFAWDGTVPLGGSHHQKVAIVDGQIAFVGSQDICQSRWDTSAHVARDPLRVSRLDIGDKPYHEVQAAVTGLPVRSLVELFCERWYHATGEILDPSALVHPLPHADFGFVATVPMPRSSIGLARTIPEGDGREPVREVRDMYVSAILEAERLVYLETQYLTSRAVCEALVERMINERKPKLDVVMFLPRKPERLKEEITIGRPQAQTLWALSETAKAHGHRLGVYDVAVKDGEGDESWVYIHSKLMIVDDRFMTIGSANLTNRSMTIDSELNLAWEAAREDVALGNAIRRVRVRLLLEHLGEAADVRRVVRPHEIVQRLDATIDAKRGRLRRHGVQREEPSPIARAMQELACEVLDPTDGSESFVARPARPTAA
jgi:phosphatidylserine/phosphatidylglycerophosphate/cardiolipin synthase-like enzyme